MSTHYINAQGVDRSKLDALSLHRFLAGYPLTTKTFTQIDSNLRVYWHTLFDLCPGLLKLDGPDGMNMFRGFIKTACAQTCSAKASTALRTFGCSRMTRLMTPRLENSRVRATRSPKSATPARAAVSSKSCNTALVGTLRSGSVKDAGGNPTSATSACGSRPSSCVTRA
mgnify:CR=1 FL=1